MTQLFYKDNQPIKKEKTETMKGKIDEVSKIFSKNREK